MNPFFLVKNNDNTWHIECRCIIYRAKLGKHPSWANPVGNAREGFNTKYYLLIDDYITCEQEAKQAVESLNKQYADLIQRCENTGIWDDFPFKDNEIVYWK